MRQDILKEVRGAWGIVLNTLRGGDDSDSTPRVIVTDELTPMFASMIERGAVAAVLAASGGRYSHGAILARSFGVPAIVGVRDLLRRVTEGTILAVNGDDGSVLVNPTPEETQQSRGAPKGAGRAPARAAGRGAPAGIHEGRRARRGDGECRHAARSRGNRPPHDRWDWPLPHRVPFPRQQRIPSEDEQYHQYRRAIEKIGRRPVVFRTLDSGGDKPLPYFQTPKEANPAMGWRGLRISLEVPDLFIPQSRAILRAGAHGDARLLVPMVTSAEEMVRVREILASILADLKATGVPHRADMPLGAMIEVPAAALTMDAIAEVSDFVSIGTNDLVQYLLGVDRDNTRVGGLYDPFHPGVLRTIAEVVSKARTSNRDVSLCGELAGDPQTTALLAGLGLRCLSMAPVAVPQVKAAVRSFSMSEAGELATSALASRSATEVREKVRALEDRRSHSGGTHQAGGSQPTGRSQ